MDKDPLIYTLSIADEPPGQRILVKIDVTHGGELDLDQLDELMQVAAAGASVGLRCWCPAWHEDGCYRGRAADYLYLAGAQIIHLGQTQWEHKYYATERWDKLYDERTIARWTRRINATKGIA